MFLPKTSLVYAPEDKDPTVFPEFIPWLCPLLSQESWGKETDKSSLGGHAGPLLPCCPAHAPTGVFLDSHPILAQH